MAKDKKTVCISIIMLTIVLVSIIPLIYIAQYNHSAADDYTYGLLTHMAWNSTHSIIEVIKAAIEHVGNYYIEWQGTFSAMFFMAIQPAIFGENFYGLSTIILILTFIASNIFLWKTVCMDYLKANKFETILITSLIIFLSMQLVPSPVQSFYWYNGAIFYTFFYSLSLVLFALILKFLKCQNKGKNLILIPLIAILCILIGGSNYTTALLTNILLAFLLIYLFITRNNKKYALLFCEFLCIISLIISMVAPGNSVRAEQYKNTPGIVGAILESILEGIKFIQEQTNIWVILFALLLVPIIYRIVKRIDYSFKYPVLFILISISVFSARIYSTNLCYGMDRTIKVNKYNVLFVLYFIICKYVLYYRMVSKEKYWKIYRF